MRKSESEKLFRLIGWGWHWGLARQTQDILPNELTVQWRLNGRKEKLVHEVMKTIASKLGHGTHILLFVFILPTLTARARG